MKRFKDSDDAPMSLQDISVAIMFLEDLRESAGDEATVNTYNTAIRALEFVEEMKCICGRGD